jgi:hypothetical protein
LFNNIIFFVVDSALKFKNLLGIIKTTINIATIYNSGKNILLIVTKKFFLYLRDISVNQIYMKENNIYVEYEIKEKIQQRLFCLKFGIFEIKTAFCFNLFC